MESLQQSSEQTLLFCEQAARLLASVKEQYSTANALISKEDSQDLQDFINSQIKGYEKLEIYGGLKIVSAKIENKDGTDLKFTIGVAEDGRLYKKDGIHNSEMYLGYHEGKDLYLNGGKLRIRSNGNPKNDLIVTIDLSQLPEAREARERSNWMYADKDTRPAVEKTTSSILIGV